MSELKHYGVQGMKLGIRNSKEVEAYKKGANKKSDDYGKGLAKAKDTAANRLYSRHTKELNATVNRQSTGKAFVKSLLFGSYGALKYDKSRTEKKTSKGRAALTAVFKANANLSTGNLIGKGEYVSNLANRNYKVSKKIKPAVEVVRDSVNTTRAKIKPKK